MSAAIAMTGSASVPVIYSIRLLILKSRSLSQMLNKPAMMNRSGHSS